MRLIPGKTKVQIELFKGISILDMLVGAVLFLLGVFMAFSSFPGKNYILLAWAMVAIGLLVRLDTVPNYQLLIHVLRFYGYNRSFRRRNDEKLKEIATPLRAYQKKDVEDTEDTVKAANKKNAADKKRAKKERKAKDIRQIISYTGVQDDCIEYNGQYYGAVMEIPPVEFRFFSSYRRRATIEDSVGRMLRSINPEYSANIVKLERPIQYEKYLAKEYEKLENLRRSFENGLLNEEELKARVEILYDRINELHRLCGEEKVIAPFYYIVLFEKDKKRLANQIESALGLLHTGEIEAKRLDTKELAVFLKYSGQIDFDEHEIDALEPEEYALWAMPESVEFTPRRVITNHVISYTMRIVGFPALVDDAWLASVMSMSGTKCVVKCKPMDRAKAIRGIDRSLQELRGQLMMSTLDSKIIELNKHINTLSRLLTTLQQDNENLLQTNIYVTVYDIVGTRNDSNILQPPISLFPVIAEIKKTVRRLYQEHGFRLSNMEFDQMQGFIGSQISGWDPLPKEGRGIPTNTIAACYPWVFANVSDEGGIHLGSSDNIPVFVDFFRRDSERVNSNMVIVGKSGSGKSYATKDILTNLAAEDSKIFILDPENEYSELAKNLHGKFINVGNAKHGRINPFQIITALDDEDEGTGVTGSYATHLQFLEEFFRQILPDCDKDAMEYLNNMVDRMYMNFDITPETDLSKLVPEDYPVFDDLYDVILEEFQRTDNEYIRSILRILMNYIAKFSTDGRNANIWNGPSTITTDENFTVFNFQSLLANRNGTIANAQMLLVLKYVDNEIIKNREYNNRYHLQRKIVVVIDEAHVFIDTKFPVALDFMFQLAKRIRKYNGMQIVITQNIKDFVGSEEIARKSTAIINACQYSFIFSLSPNDMQDLCTLYQKAGGINETEQEQITSAPRGQAFSVMGPYSRSTFKIEVPEEIVEMFQEDTFVSRYFVGEQGKINWENFVGDSREKREASAAKNKRESRQEEPSEAEPQVRFVEIPEEEWLEEQRQQRLAGGVSFEEIEEAPLGGVSFEEIEEAPLGGVSFEKIEEAPPGGADSEEAKERPLTGKADFGEVRKEAYIPEAEPRSAATQEILSNLLQEFSQDAMEYRVQNAVQKQLELALAQGSLLAAPQPVKEDVSVETDTGKAFVQPEEMGPRDSSAPPIQPEETGEASGVVAERLGKEMEAMDSEEAAALLEEMMSGELGEDFQAVSEENSDSEQDSDIMSLLSEQAEQLQEISVIEMMDLYGEKVVEITLEELADYVNSVVYKG